MFVRTSSRKNKDGTVVRYVQLAHKRYVQLAHNQWDPATKSAKMKVLYNFGRAEQVDRAGVERLIASLSKLLDSPGLLTGEDSGLEGLSFTESRPLGGAWVLDALWRRLGVDKTMRGLLGKTRRARNAPARGLRLRTGAAHPPADRRVRPGRFTGRPVRVARGEALELVGHRSGRRLHAVEGTMCWTRSRSTG